MQYWPASKEKDETHGGISISVLHEEELANFHIRTFLLAKKEEGAVRFNFKQLTWGRSVTHNKLWKLLSSCS
jgi:hypothetical protein